MLQQAVIQLLKTNLWDLATCADGQPNVVPVAFKDVTDQGQMVVADVFLKTTLRNLQANNGRIAVSVYDAQSLEGYQIQGTARYVTEGPVAESLKATVAQSSQGALSAKGALMITPEKVIVTTPGPDNKKEL